MTHLYLIRHADYIYDLVDGQFPMRNQGLSAKGMREAEHLRDRLIATREITPDIFISSTERGARETAEILAPVWGLPIVFNQDFEEWRSEDGSLSNEVFMERWAQVPKSQKPYYRWVEGCENMLEFSLRVHLALNHVLQQHARKTIVVLTHGAFIQTSFAFFFGYGQANHERAVPEISRTSITHWYQPADEERWILGRSNDCYHLERS